MANTTPDKLRGILVPRAQLTQDNFWAGESTFTQANPRAGIPKPRQSDTGMVLIGAGEQTDNYSFETVQGGLPGSAGFVWNQSDGVRIGKDHFNLLSEYEIFKFETSSTSRSQDCISDSLGNLYVVEEFINGAQKAVKVYKQARGTGTFDQVQVLLETTATTITEAKPMITILPDESILVAYFNYTEEESLNVSVHRSYDRGTTWRKISSRALLGEVDIFVGNGSTTFGHDLGKTNLITVGNNVVMVLELVGNAPVGGNDTTVFVSRDQGTTFKSLTLDRAEYHQITAIPLDNGEYFVCYISGTSALDGIVVPDVSVFFGDDFKTENAVRVATLTVATSGTNPQGGSILEEGSIDAFYEDGRIYVLAQAQTSKGIFLRVSEDRGKTWDYAGRFFDDSPISGIGYSIRTYNTTDRIENIRATMWEGRALVLGYANNSLLGMYLGGYSSVTFPQVRDQASPFQYSNIPNYYIPYFQPEVSNKWSVNGSGSATLTSDGLQIQTVANQRYYNGSTGSNPNQVFTFKLKVTSGGVLNEERIAFRKFSDNGVNSWKLSIRFSTLGFQIWDNANGLQSRLLDMTNFHEFIVSAEGRDVDVYYRTADGNHVKKWEKVSVTLGQTGTGLGNNYEFGHFVSQPCISVWLRVGIGEGGYFIDDGIQRPATYPTYGTYTYIDEGLSITAKESPAREGEEYEVEPRYDFPIQNIFHHVSPSPRVVWRSQNDTTHHTLGIFLNALQGANEPNLTLNGVAGLHLSNINFETFTIQFWDIVSMSWQNHLTVNVSDGLTGTYQRKGNTLIPASTGNPFYLHYNECAGWRADLGSGHVVKLKTNSEGVWGRGNHKEAIIMIDEESDYALSLPNNGTMKLIPDSVTITTELLQSSNPGQEAFAIRIPVQDTLEGYFQIGMMVYGHVAFMAPQYQRGRSISFEPNIQGMTTLDNTFQSRRLSNGSRTFQIAWTEPVDSRNIMSRTPDYWQLSTSVGSQPVANYGDSPFQMMGIWDYLGNQYPAVYLPSITKGVDNQVFNRTYEHALVRPVGAITIESVLGEEQENEMFRVASITLQEIE